VKTIGMLGGMSWESTIPYYQIINQTVASRLGGLHSARLVLHSVDFDDVEKLQHADRWEEAGQLLADASQGLQDAGADFLMICTNTMHRVAPAIETRISIPLLHIADPTADAIKAAGFDTVGLLGTRFTMEQDFYRGRLEDRFGLNVIVPDSEARRRIHDVIYDELCRGIISESSRENLVKVVATLAGTGAQAVILGCTEIGLLLREQDAGIPLFDTTRLHAEAAALLALE